jgi:hypothetical protein
MFFAKTHDGSLIGIDEKGFDEKNGCGYEKPPKSSYHLFH